MLWLSISSTTHSGESANQPARFNSYKPFFLCMVCSLQPARSIIDGRCGWNTRTKVLAPLPLLEGASGPSIERKKERGISTTSFSAVRPDQISSPTHSWARIPSSRLQGARVPFLTMFSHHIGASDMYVIGGLRTGLQMQLGCLLGEVYMVWGLRWIMYCICLWVCK